MFAAGFPALTDCEWGIQLGGWGGISRGYPLKHVPVIFVHGNHSDSVDWFGVADQFKSEAGYTDQELWAISYNGLGGQVDGAPVVCPCPPSPRALAYWQRPDVAPYIATGGQYASDDVNVPDLYAFIRAVQRYTGSQQVELVGHSLGVTVIRKTMFVHRDLFRAVPAVVSIAGGNHGTSLCRGSEATLYGCNEIGPGTAWLKELNSIGESPGPTRWMSIYNGTNNLDPFFIDGGVFDDRTSPRLEGAINLTYGTAYHSDLRVRPDIVSTYLKFLLQASRSTPPTSGTQEPSKPGQGRASTVGSSLPATGYPTGLSLLALVVTAGAIVIRHRAAPAAS
ncbi:MAG: triacylglycerol lipase [Frankiales bacterium]|jgi:pimeloyl-ACP methyl ester carboxylesterase|nr:triacylglycerol lipase [Frankiales bacterium]